MSTMNDDRILAADLRQLAGWIADGIELPYGAHIDPEAAAVAIESLTAERDELRCALLKYADHGANCRATLFMGDPNCSCGLSALLAKAEA